MIHTDFEYDFVKAEIVPFNDSIEAGSIARIKVKGKVRQKGKSYIMHDGDVVEFKLNAQYLTSARNSLIPGHNED